MHVHVVVPFRLSPDNCQGHRRFSTGFKFRTHFALHHAIDGTPRTFRKKTRARRLVQYKFVGLTLPYRTFGLTKEWSQSHLPGRTMLGNIELICMGIEYQASRSVSRFPSSASGAESWVASQRCHNLRCFLIGPLGPLRIQDEIDREIISRPECLRLLIDDRTLTR